MNSFMISFWILTFGKKPTYIEPVLYARHFKITFHLIVIRIIWSGHHYSFADKTKKVRLKNVTWDFPGGAVVKNPPANAGDIVLIPGPGSPTCHGTTKPVHQTTEPAHHNYWSPCALEPVCHNYWARVPRAHVPQQEKPPQWKARAPQQRVAPTRRN